MIRLVDKAHEFLAQAIRPGDIAIDATAGNGHDTQFLAELVGDTGHVFALDLQLQALTKTESLLSPSQRSRVTLIQCNHAQMREAIPSLQEDQVAAIVFNLGYLPGGDKSLTTDPESTRLAIQQSLTLLRPGGHLSITAYRGHSGGETEAQTVRELLQSLDSNSYTYVEVISNPIVSVSQSFSVFPVVLSSGYRQSLLESL